MNADNRGWKSMGSHAANRWRVSADEVDISRSEPRPVRKVRIAAEPQRVLFDAHKSALIVVDMQNDFCTKGGYLDYRGIDVSPDRKPIEPIRRLVPALRNEGIPIVWLNWGVRTDLLNVSPTLLHAHTQDGTGAGLGDPVPGGGAPILRKGSWGAAVVDEINPGGADIQVTKHRFSGFWDTELDSILRNMDRRTLFFAGVNADQCVMTSLQDAMFLGYDVLMLRDCVGTTSPAYCMEATEYNVKLLFGFMTDSGALLEGLAQAPK